MKNLFIKVGGYILMSHIIYLVTIFVTSKNAKFIKSSDLRNGEDWFYFLWLFGVPALINILIVGLPMVYALDKVATSGNRYMYYLLFAGLFLIEFSIGSWMYGAQSSILKVGISLILFLILFWKRLI